MVLIVCLNFILQQRGNRSLAKNNYSFQQNDISKEARSDQTIPFIYADSIENRILLHFEPIASPKITFQENNHREATESHIKTEPSRSSLFHARSGGVTTGKKGQCQRKGMMIRSQSKVIEYQRICLIGSPCFIVKLKQKWSTSAGGVSAISKLILNMNHLPGLTVLSQYESLQKTFEERLKSLRLQADFLPLSTRDSSIVDQLLDLYSQWKNDRGDQLLRNQCRAARHSEKERELQHYEIRILEQRHCIARKEEEIWEYSWNGKRIKYLSLHLEFMQQFSHDLDQTHALVEALAERARLQRQVSNLQKQEKDRENKTKIDFRRIDTAFLKQLIAENQKEHELVKRNDELQKELAQLSREQKNLSQKYQKLLRQRSVGHETEEGKSAKSISTSGEDEGEGE